MPAASPLTALSPDWYDPYARGKTQNRKQKTASHSRTSDRVDNGRSDATNHYNGPHLPAPPGKDNPARDVDYFGISNLMRSLDLSHPRRWRLKRDPEGPRNAWVPRGRSVKQSTVRPDYDVSSDVEQGCSDQDNRASRGKHHHPTVFSRFTYPQKYHYGGRPRFFDNIPVCLRQHKSVYANQPKRQDCKYNPGKSVTHSEVHIVRSVSLPHPDRKRRPFSAPPRSMTSLANVASGRPVSAVSMRNYMCSRASRRGFKANSFAGISDTASAPPPEDPAERNGSFSYVYQKADNIVIEVEEEGEDEDEGDSNRGDRQVLRQSSTEQDDTMVTTYDYDKDFEQDSDSEASEAVAADEVSQRGPRTPTLGGGDDVVHGDSDVVHEDSDELEIEDESSSEYRVSQIADRLSQEPRPVSTFPGGQLQYGPDDTDPGAGTLTPTRSPREQTAGARPPAPPRSISPASEIETDREF